MTETPITDMGATTGVATEPYVHGHSAEESSRLVRQADVLRDRP
ncbi:hypothetical protein ACFWIJ_34180 [Streptomyces sp. NPDC127079]